MDDLGQRRVTRGSQLLSQSRTVSGEPVAVGSTDTLALNFRNPNLRAVVWDRPAGLPPLVRFESEITDHGR